MVSEKNEKVPPYLPWSVEHNGKLVYSIDKQISLASTSAKSDVILPDHHDTDREQWGSQIDFLMSCIGYAVGLGNVWRFPYLCFQNGGGAFLFPYILFMLLTGVPLFFLEASVGQFLQQGGVTVWRVAPLFKGVGFASIVMCCLINVYYNVIVGWAVFYFIACFQSVLPWSNCDNYWNTENCVAAGTHVDNMTNASITSVEEYWERRVLEMTDGIEFFGVIRWELVICVLIAWILTYIMIWRGLHQSGKLLWFTALFPYVILTTLLIKACTLEGAGSGVLFYLTPEWDKLTKPTVWVAAATQIFFSYGIGMASLFALGSYNRYNNNIYRDAVIVGFINSGTSIYAGFCTFAILGFMAESTGSAVADVVKSGPGLTFLVYPEVLSLLPLPQLWAALFFIMLMMLGLDSQFCMVEGFIRGVIDLWPKSIKSNKKYKGLFVIFVCVVCFFAAWPMVFQGGIYLFELFNQFAASGVTLLTVVFFEVVGISWVFGADKVYDGIEDMIGFRPMIWWYLCWKFIGPFIMLAVYIFNFVEFERFLYGNIYEYPWWGYAIAWTIGSLSMVCIPLYMIYYIITQVSKAPAHLSLFESLKHALHKGIHSKIRSPKDRLADSPTNSTSSTGSTEVPPPYEDVTKKGYGTSNQAFVGDSFEEVRF